MGKLRKKITTETLIEKMPVEKCWTITAKALTGLYTMMALKTGEFVLGRGEGVIAPVSGWETRRDINTKIMADAAKRFYPWVKETFSIPVEDASEAAKLVWVVARLMSGPEWEFEYVEKTPERVVYRLTKCPWWNRYEENNVKPELAVCSAATQLMVEEGLKAVNPKITYILAKARPWGDSYCEFVFEFKEK